MALGNILVVENEKPVDPSKPTRARVGDADLAPLRERSPELYQDVLRRYEEAIKRALQHRIYKINEDTFEPFRHIAKDLFEAKATARDAVELHYHTLRKIAPTAESPGAQAYLEVGRTTIIGLMGDVLSLYRQAALNGIENGSFGDAGETAGNRSQHESEGD